MESTLSPTAPVSSPFASLGVRSEKLLREGAQKRVYGLKQIALFLSSSSPFAKNSPSSKSSTFVKKETSLEEAVSLFLQEEVNRRILEWDKKFWAFLYTALAGFLWRFQFFLNQIDKSYDGC